MRITILLPTYNRNSSAKIQVAAIAELRNRLTPFGIELDLVVSDNKSKIPFEVDPRFSSFTTLVRPDQHIPSAEGNVLFGLAHCEGEYVWAVSDDDSIIQLNAVDFLQAIAARRPDFAIANGSGLMGPQDIVHVHTLCSRAAQITRLEDFVKSTGVWFTMAGFGLIVFRRDIFVKNMQKMKEYIAISKVYSLAIFTMDAFWSCNFMYHASPVLLATQNNYADTWTRNAKADGLFHRFFWTTGTLRLLEKFEQSRSLPAGFFAEILDQSVTGRFPLLAAMAVHTVTQLIEEIKGNEKECRHMSNAEIEELVGFFMRHDGRIALIVSGAVEARRRGGANRDVLEKMRKANAILEGFLTHYYDLFFVAAFNDWHIYKFDGFYRAVRSDDKATKLRVFRDITPISGPDQIVGVTIDDVVTAIALLPARVKNPENTVSVVAPMQEIWGKQDVHIYFRISSILRALRKIFEWSRNILRPLVRRV